MKILSAIKHINVSFRQKLESTQYNVALAITRAIGGTSSEKLYHEFGFESFESRGWYFQPLLFL